MGYGYAFTDGGGGQPLPIDQYPNQATLVDVFMLARQVGGELLDDTVLRRRLERREDHLPLN